MGIQDEVRKLVNTESARHKRLIEYVTRQLRAGRKLADVLDDPYVVGALPGERPQLATSSTAGRSWRSPR